MQRARQGEGSCEPPTSKGMSMTMGKKMERACHGGRVKAVASR
ncbi:MAG: hypothetical protein PUD39_04380 [Bacteroidales bacterium]|nr:hypothetical protein [Bacteroidales bacterium]